MNDSSQSISKSAGPLLADDEDAAVRVVNRRGSAPFVLTCDHASNRIPRRLNGLELNPRHLDDHIAVDIGAADLTQALSERLNAVALLSEYSRLVVDLNRWPEHPELMPATSDGIVIPGNRALSRDQVAARMNDLFHPYQNQLTALVAAKELQSAHAALVCVHSFTPRLNSAARNTHRPWHVGILWADDERLSSRMLDALRQVRTHGGRSRLDIGENEPYHGKQPLGYTLGYHAVKRKRPCVIIEVRQDLIRNDRGVNHWSDLLSETINDAVISLHADFTPSGGLPFV